MLKPYVSSVSTPFEHDVCHFDKEARHENRHERRNSRDHVILLLTVKLPKRCDEMDVSEASEYPIL